jgi:diguanylate cyclase
LVAVGLLTSAFASVARRGQTYLSSLWLIGWAMIMLHFGAYIFISSPGHWGDLANFTGTAALALAGMLFTWASVPYRRQPSSLWIFVSLIASVSLYLGILLFGPPAFWALIPSAILIGALPLTIALVSLPRFKHPLRWTVVAIYLTLSLFLLAFQFKPNYGAGLALNAIFFTIYLGCAFHFWYGYRRATAGAFITIAGFFAWANVFLVGPIIAVLFPTFHADNEVWNLPKYVVAVGMILLLLEDQIEHNRYLALHDELTGLPNRRLFQDRLANTLERARRNGSQAALLQIDLDHFKQVNDTVGHHVGDELLKRVGGLFLGRIRRSDTVARTGGDEFCVILEDPMSRADAVRVGQALTQLLESPFEVNGHTVRVGASVGIAIYPDDASDAEALCIAADLRMYATRQAARAKEAANIPRPFPPSSIQSQNPQTGFRLAE